MGRGFFQPRPCNLCRSPLRNCKGIVSAIAGKLYPYKCLGHRGRQFPHLPRRGWIGPGLSGRMEPLRGTIRKTPRPPGVARPRPLTPGLWNATPSALTRSAQREPRSGREPWPNTPERCLQHWCNHAPFQGSGPPNRRLTSGAAPPPGLRCRAPLGAEDLRQIVGRFSGCLAVAVWPSRLHIARTARGASCRRDACTTTLVDQAVAGALPLHAAELS